jgi:flagellar basal-body rod protein FlgB
MESISSQFDLLGRLIRASEMRQRVISNNLTNVNTPNYRRLDVDFEAQLAEELQGRGFGEAQPEIFETPGLKTKADGNNVDVDREIGQLNKNAMLSQAYIQLLGHNLSQMRLAIEGS